MTDKRDDDSWELWRSGGDTGDVSYHRNVEWPRGNGYRIVLRAPRPRGRPIITDWQGAFKWFVAKVARDGLPEKQERATELLLAWFEDKGVEPSQSEVAKHVHEIYEEHKRIR